MLFLAHPLYVVGLGWTAEGKLRAGEKIATRSGFPLVVQSVAWRQRAQGFRVYNIGLIDPSGLSPFSDWYWGGMGGLSNLTDQMLMNGSVGNLGTVAGEHDSGCVSDLELAKAGLNVAGNAAMLVVPGGEEAKAAEEGLRVAEEVGGGAQSLGKAYHYTFSSFADKIESEGLNKPINFLTPEGGLSPLQAQLELALPPNGLRDALYEVDLDAFKAAGGQVPEAGLVGRMFNLPGGGQEFRITDAIAPQFLTRLR